jgi:hypothetical protein
VRATVSYPMYRQFLEDNRTLEDLFACAPPREHRRGRNPGTITETRSPHRGMYESMVTIETNLGDSNSVAL